MQVDEIRKVAVVGAGLMGHGIAQEFALGGYEVRLVSRSKESLERALHNIRGNLDRLMGFGMVSREQAEAVPDNIYPTTEFAEAIDSVDVVIESVYEDLELKKQIFQQLDEMCPERTILASNTSSLMPSAFAAATRRPDRVLVTHYANPPYLIPLVEIVRGRNTSDETVVTISGLLEKLGKRTIVAQKEVPGFILNRLQAALLREALWLVENGVASPQEVDAGIRNSIGRRWAVAGVFEIFDLAGWDLLLNMVSELQAHLSASPKVSPVLAEKVQCGELGVKTGKGFYEWTPEAAEGLRERIAQALIEIEKWSVRNERK